MNTLSEILNDVKKDYQHINPILVLAPIQRCGSTLLQRAINAGGEAVIYGENFLMLEKIPNIIGGPFTDVDSRLSITKKASDEFFGGNLGMDATALFPDYSEYLKSLIKSNYELLNCYDNFSKSKGYKNWGIKNQLVDVMGFRNFLAIVPNSRAVIIYRDVIDVAKSFKARWPKQLENEKQFEALGHRWAQNLHFLLTINHPKKLVIKYEEMVKDPTPYIDEMENILGVTLSRDEFKRKINTNVGKDNKTGDAYIPPSDLSENEIKALLKHTSPLYNNLGYKA